MNWLTDKFQRIKPKIKNLFRVKIGPEGKLWENCSCGAVLYKQDLKQDLYVCNKCNKHHRIEPKERFQIFFDEGQYQEISPMLPAIDDPFLFTDSKTYGMRLKQAREETGQHDCVMLATGKVNNVYLVAGAQNFNFMAGSVGRAAGEAFVAGAEFAYANKLPYIFFSCSGGMRMQEAACLSLMQMPRMIAAINSLKQEKLPFISVCLDPTTGGQTASVALLGDINIAEPNALVAFAGARVIKETVREDLPLNFQRAEFLLEKGMLDLVVQRKDLPKVISTLISQLTNKNKYFTSELNAVSEQQQSPLKSFVPPSETSS
jgi:acetyl-CoA carboxylase carboxyl transferase subunit beta